jgi:hypothetical protein
MRVTEPRIDRGMNLIVDFAQCCFGLGIGPQDQRRSVERPDPIEGEFDRGPALG